MIDQFSIFHRGGGVLWERSMSSMSVSPVDALIGSVLLEERAASTSYRHDKYVVKWTFANELELVFVAVYLNVANLLFIDQLLDAVKDSFVALVKPHWEQARKAYTLPAVSFDRRFDRIVAQFELGSLAARKGPRSFEEANKPTTAAAASGSGGGGKTGRKQRADEADADSKEGESGEGRNDEDGSARGEAEGDTGGGSASSGSDPAVIAGSSSGSGGFNADKLRAMQHAMAMRGQRPMRAGPPSKKKGKDSKDAASGKEGAEEADGKKKRVKQATKWDDKISKEDAKALDFSRKAASGGEEEEKAQELSGVELAKQYGFVDKDATSTVYSDHEDDDDDDGEGDAEDDDEQDDDTEAAGATDAAKSGRFSSVYSLFSRLAGTKVLERSDMEGVLSAFKQQLMAKNVAHEIAEKLCESVAKSLEGKKLGYASVKSTVYKAIEEALTRILTPARQVDIMQGIMAAQADRRPYSIVFLGVNGVGKSTSLAKTAAYFLSKGLKVGIGACDTFRSGAIEQLRTHCSCLGVPLYAKGYDRDAAYVASEAISAAKKDGLDVVLIDTAGRMQDNEPLMRALSKLIQLNRPDLVLFVGEALVGNDAVDQAAKFNRCLSDLSGDAQPRLIDGIVLTKFDTIDDKVGAAISMAYTTGRPIMFVGTGQTYKDLKRMNVKTLIKSLLR